MFFSDDPIKHRDEDRLGRKQFAERLAEGIIQWEGGDSSVIGLYGDWGAGKTSILNMTVEALENADAGKQLIIARFNPWGFSGHLDLLAIAFRELAAAIGRDSPGKLAQGLGKLLQTYAGLLELMPVPPPVPNIMSRLLRRLGASLSRGGEARNSDLRAVRSLVEQSLRDLGRRILVIIDDIDRLSDEEIREIFKLVKVVGDFPNTMYLLAFDPSIVQKALEETQRGAGAQYLEKIVQLPFQVPQPASEKISDELTTMLNSVLRDVPQG